MVSKNFTLLSDIEDGFSWNISAQILENSSFNKKGSIQIRDNKENYQKGKEYNRQYRESHEEEAKKYLEKWREENPDYFKNWYEDNKERWIGYNAKQS